MPSIIPYLVTFKTKLNIFRSTWQQQGIGAALQRSYRWFLRRYFNVDFTTYFDSYENWVNENALTAAEINAAKNEIKNWTFQPKFSVLIPVYNIDEIWLKKAIQSVQNQIYPHWELCIADDASTKPHIKNILNAYSKKDARIKVTFCSENRGISAASNAALALATGDYIALLDHDDELSVNALYENAKLIQQHPDADFIYSDEDKINPQGKRSDPFLKPGWSPEFFYAVMYTCHLGVYRTALVKKIGGFRSECDGSQDYDLVLRLIEQTENIYHIPKILYHWRIIPSSAASSQAAKPWAYDAAVKALQDMLERNQQPGQVEQETCGIVYYRVRRKIMNNPLVSIIIPSAGKRAVIRGKEVCLLENCVENILKKSSYRNFEIVVVDGYDIAPEVISTLRQLFSEEEMDRFQFIRCDQPFNYSQRINYGAAIAKGDVFLLLNDDTEVITCDWLESLLEVAQHPDVGAVGGKLLFEDGRIQHAGVLIIPIGPSHVYYGFDGNHPGYVLSNKTQRNYLAVTAACLMTRRACFEQVSGMDESFAVNYNDVDFCLKLHQAGYRNVFTPYAQLFHYESMTRPPVVTEAEMRHFKKRWQGYIDRLGGDPYYNPNFNQGNPFFQTLW